MEARNKEPEMKKGVTLRSINTLRHLPALMLTIAALMAGLQTARATTKTVTYTMTSVEQSKENASYLPIGSIAYNETLGAYEINCADNLNDLAVYVRGSGDYTTGGSETNSHPCANLVFKMTADITIPHTTAWNDDSSTEENYTPIGAYTYASLDGRVLVSYLPFSGTFDGDGHTVSGIRIYSDAATRCKGIFGSIENGTVQNLTIADARFTGYSDIGGIVGRNRDGVVSGCHATATVAFRSVKSGTTGFGGIVGYNENVKSGCTVSGCTSAAVFSIDSSVNAPYGGSFGGIVGTNDENCTISGCTAAGVILPNLPDSYGGAGAIVGKNIYGGTLTGNTYHSCLIGGTYAFNIGVGTNYIALSSYNAGDVSGGATLVTTTLWLYDNRNNSNLATAYAKPYGRDNSSTAHGGTYPSVHNVSLTLKGRTFYKDGTWNTLALPFNVSTLSGTPLSGATIMTLDKDNTAFDSGTGALTVAFKSASSISQKTPYIVKWASGSDVTDPTFNNVSAASLATYTQTITADLVKFSSNKAPISSTDGKLLDPRNTDNRGYHSYMTITAPDAPEGYSFTGWNTAADGSGTDVTSLIPFDGGNASFTIYAQWAPTFTGITLGTVNNKLTATFHGTSIDTVSIPTDINVDSIVLNRTFTAGKPATIMLPFTYTCNGSEGGKFYEFVGVEQENDQWIATMRDTEDPLNKVTTLVANTPYLVMPSAILLTFTGGATLNTTGGGNQQSTDGDWTFHGTYTYLTYGTDPFSGTVFGFAAKAGTAVDGQTAIEAGQFVKAAAGAYMPPLRAYLTYSGSNTALHAPARGAASAPAIPDRIKVRLLSSGGAVTAVGTMDLGTGEVTVERWFYLNGTPVDGTPVEPGLYLNDSGKKVMIK